MYVAKVTEKTRIYNLMIWHNDLHNFISQCEISNCYQHFQHSFQQLFAVQTLIIRVFCCLISRPRQKSLQFEY